MCHSDGGTMLKIGSTAAVRSGLQLPQPNRFIPEARASLGYPPEMGNLHISQNLYGI